MKDDNEEERSTRPEDMQNLLRAAPGEGREPASCSFQQHQEPSMLTVGTGSPVLEVSSNGNGEDYDTELFANERKNQIVEEKGKKTSLMVALLGLCLFLSLSLYLLAPSSSSGQEVDSSNSYVTSNFTANFAKEDASDTTSYTKSFQSEVGMELNGTIAHAHASSSTKDQPNMNVSHTNENNNNHSKTVEEKEEEKEPAKDADINSLPKHVLSSYSYSNCPFIMAKFSQDQLAREGHFKSEADRLTNSIDRAKSALDFSNDAFAYDRVVSALENNAFDGRKIVLDGDSLTRQFFISLGCLAWSAGYVEDYDVPEYIYEGGLNSVLNNAQYEASSKLFTKGSITLKGGGRIFYIANPSEEKIETLSERMIHEACDNTNATKKQYQARYNFNTDLLHMKAKDVVVYGAGHHTAERLKYISTYKRFFSCMKNGKSTSAFKRWPHMMYQLASVEHFWTENGGYGGTQIEGSDGMTCRPSTNFSPHREEERAELGGLVPFIGDTIDVENLGEFHVWHGDCLHWIQPGIPDLYAGELADFLLSTM